MCYSTWMILHVANGEPCKRIMIQEVMFHKVHTNIANSLRTIIGKFFDFLTPDMRR